MNARAITCCYKEKQRLKDHKAGKCSNNTIKTGTNDSSHDFK